MKYTVVTNRKFIDKKRWSDFVFNHPQGNIFQTPQMVVLYDNIPKYTPVVVFAMSDEKIEGVLVACIQREYSGLAGRFTARSIIQGGPLIKDNNVEICGLLLKEYGKLIPGQVIYSQFRNFFDISAYKEELQKNGFVYEDHLDVLFDLTKTAEDLEKEVHKERKRNISRAVNKGVCFKILNSQKEIETAIDLIWKTYGRIKLPKPPGEIFVNGIKCLGPGEIVFFGAEFEGKLIASRAVCCYKDLVYDWYSGCDYDYTNKYPNDYLPWKVILWAKEAGYKRFDFGGAGKPGVPYGVRDYKRKFGGELVNYGRCEKIHKKLTFLFMKAFFKVWRIFRKA